MAKILIKRGNKANLPALSDGEIALCKDTGGLYVGNGGINQQIGALIQSGTWTPTIQCADSYSVQEGFFYKIGRHVALCCRLTFVMKGGYLFNITGLPFTASYSAATMPSEISSAPGFIAQMIHLRLQAGSSTVELMSDNNSGSGLSSWGTDSHDDCLNRTATCTINFTLDYITAS